MFQLSTWDRKRRIERAEHPSASNSNLLHNPPRAGNVRPLSVLVEPFRYNVSEILYQKEPVMNNKSYCARTADKFVTRMPDGMRKRIEELAAKNHTSMNTEIVRALEAHLSNQSRQKLLLDALEAQLRTATPIGSKESANQPEVDYLDGLKSGTR